MQYAVITENDESKWDDIPGVQYHFPSKYVNILTPGTQVIYYKGRMEDPKFLETRLSPKQHYFAIAEIGKVSTDNKKDYYAKIVNYSPFKTAISFKKNGAYLEDIPSNKQGNYFRDGVRPVSQANFNKILIDILGEVKDNLVSEEEKVEEGLTTVLYEGKKKIVYTTRYERVQEARDKAIEIHGLSCMGCGFDFEKWYGARGKGFIHVHHNKPLYVNGKKMPTNPAKDLDVVCPNCHAMIHRRKAHVLTVQELKNIIQEARGKV